MAQCKRCSLEEATELFTFNKDMLCKECHIEVVNLLNNVWSLINEKGGLRTVRVMEPEPSVKPVGSRNPIKNAKAWLMEKEWRRLLLCVLIGILLGIAFAQATITNIREWCVMPDPIEYCKQNSGLRTTHALPGDVIIEPVRQGS